MRFTIDRDVLYDALRSVNRVIPTKPMYQLADCILFEFDESQNLVMAGSDSMSTIIVRRDIPMVDDSKGRVVIQAAPLLDFVKALPDGGVVMDAAARVAVFKAGQVKLVLNLADASLYPQLPEPEKLPEAQWTEFSVGGLHEALKMVAPATPDDLSRQNLAMVSVQKNPDGEGSMLRACDGMRLHQFINESLVIPEFDVFSLTVDNLIKVLAATSYETGSLWVGETGIAVRLGTDYVVLQSPVVSFPDVTKSLLHPTLANDWPLKVDRDQLAAAIERTRVVADQDTRAIHLNLAGNTLLIRTKNSVGSYATESLPVEWEGSDTKLVFRYSHLLDVLKVYPGAACTVWVDDKSDYAPVRLSAGEAKFDAVISQLKVELL